MAYDQECRDKARKLYVADGMTFEQISEALDINTSTLWRWAQSESWRQQREHLRADLDDIRTNTIRLRKKLIRKVMDSLDGGEVDPQKIFAVSSLEGTTAKLIKEDAASDMKMDDIREIKTAGEAVSALMEAVQGHINRMLNVPGSVSLAAIRDMKSALAMIEDLKKVYGADEAAQSKGLSDEAAAEIRRKIIGLKE